MTTPAPSTCAFCGSALTRRTQHKYCSSKCAAAVRRGKPISDALKAKVSETHKGKPKSDAWRRAISEALKASDKLVRNGEANPNYRHGRYVGERDYRALVTLDKCEECGATDRILDVHHIDHNHSNNARENLQVLCHTCHGKKHGRPVGVKESRPRARKKHAVLR